MELEPLSYLGIMLLLFAIVITKLRNKEKIPYYVSGLLTAYLILISI